MEHRGRSKLLPDVRSNLGLRNQEILDRMKAAGFTEILSEKMGMLTPTFRNPSGGKILHQIDHFIVSEDFVPKVTSCQVRNQDIVFGRNLSDHLPIIADFE